MSGTSLDGLDICAVNFIYSNGTWEFNILNSETILYSSRLKEKFSLSTTMSSIELLKFDLELGQLIGSLTKQFIISNRLRPDFIASHGHTVFHQPEKGITLQIGNGQQIALETGLPVVCDFRTKDVSLGGQGAPLVPIGDRELFSQYDACINLGGIANISYNNSVGNRIAFDICPFNMGLNYLANELGMAYDESGKISKKGNLDTVLLEKLNNLDFYKQSFPKSLGVEWFNAYCLPLINTNEVSIQDRLHTFSHHISAQISALLEKLKGETVLISGGGAYNDFVIDLIKAQTSKDIIKPSNSIIDFKEALVFAFLGVLRMNNDINVLKSVTGASKDSSSGIIVLP
jgi:anhydro-N-acetylmuramic acid kinase